MQASAYRIQALGPDAVVDPVMLRTSPTYCSHLGHLSIDGITVEIMGAMERHEEGRCKTCPYKHFKIV